MSNVQGATAPQVPSLTSDGGYGSGSWLVALALALGKAMSKLQDDMMKDAKEAGGKGKGATEANARLQAESQLYSMVANAINTVIKAVGEANTTLARKS
ncbi:hypothetical protein ASG87_17845 [Frateuria sp. Soil773]|uniref:hypothetical protein n=1 Tax=Frateuria sp. Soil773 TaxID=1736407 RepID=UPI0006F8A9BD|nr:hypothetical protein [Frateuria sp. Soil773]KRE94465.1 hypothetical protein ASG87_17845 [Frateuria sp. Soil773]